ncbi:Zinc finger, RING-type [Corchorus olitorius]|uniref:Zinc finger, RING-type n=1 Tax=Corchorus olitorius TaxID=93759 RepID=A0A1R3JZR7_9ROSI|nr:Zinc finger, RING-type [Corchorus olitorius]
MPLYFPEKRGLGRGKNREEKENSATKRTDREAGEMIGDNSFSKTICSICYEDLKPIVEDLQTISICGHVFHELCLQQWFEYCSKPAKKYSCPVCKQHCIGHNAIRLYFQSVGDQSDSLCSQKLIDREEDAGALRIEVKKLLAKVSGLTSSLERQEKENKEINEELCLCKEQIRKEITWKNEALREKAFIQQELISKSAELSKSNSECSRLEQRSIALAKEIAVLKLVSDLDLEQDEIFKLASLGNEANSQDTVDNLVRSLASHKKSYKELMTKCNILGRGEARLEKKLEKAKQKIDKLKRRVQELETSIEVKDNEVLRTLKASKKTDCEGVILVLDDDSNTLKAKNSLTEQMQHSNLPLNNLDLSGRSLKDSPRVMKENIHSGSPRVTNHITKGSSTVGIEEDRNPYRDSTTNLNCRNRENIVGESAPSMSKAVSDVKGEATNGTDRLSGFSGSRTCSATDKSATLLSASKPMFNIRTEAPSSLPLAEQGNPCFSGGLVGPDGTKWHLGKWCKRGKVPGSMPTQGSTKSSGDLISVGADGRGGRIKVMRSLNQSSMDDKENSVSAKRLKYGAKTNSVQNQGYLQIEHFFGKAQY